MRTALRISSSILLLGAVALAADNNKYDLSQAQIDDVIQKFAAKEAQFSKAREVYTYRQTARVQSLDDGGAVTGRWETVSDVIFSPEGNARNVVRSRFHAGGHFVDARRHGGHAQCPAVCLNHPGFA